MVIMGRTVLTAIGKGSESMMRYFHSRGWKDFIFLSVVLALGGVAEHYHLLEPRLNDEQKWRVRPELSPQAFPMVQKPGESGLPPCLFLVPPNAVDQPVVSGSIGDCLLLVPNGKKLDLFEMALVGLVMPVKTDLYVPDTVPLAFTRTYLPLNNWSHTFQVYLPNVYDLFLTGHRRPYTDVDWRLPDGQSIHYDRISSGTGYADAVFEENGFMPVFMWSRMNWNGWGWDLTLQDGTTYLSPEAYSSTRPQQGSLVGIFDKDGNEVRLSRKKNGDLEQILSPSGRWIKLRFNKERMIEAEDSSGNVVQYSYDNGNRLETVRYPAGNTTKYSYDSGNRITAIEDSSQGISLRSRYDDYGVLIEESIGNGLSYRFQHKDSWNVDVIDPSGELTRVKMRVVDHRTYYTVEKISGTRPPHHE
jgi:YD repeat-containing protein